MLAKQALTWQDLDYSQKNFQSQDTLLRQLSMWCYITLVVQNVAL